MNIQPRPLIAVSSVKKSKKWYCSLFGADIGHGGEHYEQIIVNNQLILQLHNMEADENHESLAQGGALGNGVVLWFSTDDFEALVLRAKKAGITPERPVFFNERAKQMELWFIDPDGYRVVVNDPSEYTLRVVTEKEI